MYLNILFILSCVPIITIFPAVAALFGVVREWKLHKEVAVFSQYKQMFMGNWKQSYLVGILYTIMGMCIGVDWLFLNQIQSSLKLFIFSGVLVVSFLYLISFLSIFPIMVNMTVTFKQLCMNSLKLGLYKIHLSIFCIIVLGAWTFLSLYFPFLMVFFFFSVSAYIIYWIADLKFAWLLVREDSTNKVTSV
ncbi:YesL family protein [Neobacillus kokaensis]|uniref:DUF624 domain-containing protein n=1 Tax=Neobacillus kokaensis TaxID=2759023 RepID=A0ABQ3N2T2_9BACI|nr:DUF624 domain-containing protein [Neobacillus kokaensis]GHH97818.1 hypothetical protein AM1BK_13610 [Neobacillus kokaensis]